MFDPREQPVGWWVRLIGRLLWDPPRWWVAFRERELPPAAARLQEWALRRLPPLIERLRDWGERLREKAPEGRRLAAGCLAASLGVLILARWYQSRPEVAYLSVAVDTPPATPLRDKALPTPLYVRFGGSAARLADIGRPVEKGVTISPSLPGRWHWETDAVLAFTPRLDWAVGQDYTIRLEERLFPDHIRIERMDLPFKTESFSARVSAGEFYQDPRDPKIKKAVWTLAFSHPVDASDLERRLRVAMAGEAPGWFSRAATFPFHVSYDKYKGEAYVHSGLVRIPDQDSSISLSIEGGVRSSRGGKPHADPLRSGVPVPGMYNFFRVQDAAIGLPRNARSEPEQALIFRFSAGVREKVVRERLQAWVLPRDLPPTAGRPGETNHYWSDPARVGPEVLAVAARLELEALPADADFATMHSFRFRAPPGRHLYVRIGKGAECYGGYILAKDFDSILQVPEFPRELRFMSEGALLSLSGDRRLSVLSRGVEAVRFEIGRVLPGQVNHLLSQSGGNFRNPEFENWRFGMEDIAERQEEVRVLAAGEPGRTQYSALDLGRYLSAEDKPRGLFLLKAASYDPLRKQDTGVTDGRLVLVTDLGLLVKDNQDKSHDVFVQSLKDGEPAAGVRVEVLGRNGLVVLSATTDAQGRASFPSLESFEREKRPVAYVARLDGDLSFIPYDWADRRLDLSRFDIGGRTSHASEGVLTAFLFSDRGVYRPGEEIRVGLIVKGSDWAQNLAGVPLELSVTDSRGLEVLRRRIRLSVSGFEELRHATEETSPTGRYQASVFVVKDDHRGGLLGSVDIRVEEFLPDRMRIATSLSAERERGWVAPKDLTGRVNLRNLFGTPAEGRRIAATVSLAAAPPVFASYPDHVFFDPQRAKNSFSERLADGRTDVEGEAEFDLGLSRFEKATYRLLFAAEGFESGGGRSVSSESSVIVSDLAYLVGYKPDGDLHHVHRGSARSVELIAVGPRLERVPVEGLSGILIERRYVSVLQRRDNGTYAYESLLRETELSRHPVALGVAGYKFAVPAERAGDFALIVKDQDDLELARVPFSVVGDANLSRSLDKNAELQVRLDRSDYTPGQEIEVQVRAPYTGAGLITIERDRVYASRWFKTATTGSVQRIRIPEGLEGNAYVHVTFLRALDSPEVFMSPLSYGIAPFSLSRGRRTNQVTLEVPELARPGEPYRIKYSTAKRGRIAIFAVDEGILQVARYQTPEPLAHFFAKRALEVRTHQILDLLLPEFKLLQALSAPGGDEGSRALGKNLNPFKRRKDPAVAYWSGIVDSGPETRELVYPMQDHFSGSVRVMAVVVSPDSLGTQERRSTVRGHFTLSPNAPTFASPGDEFTVTVAVSNHVEGSGADSSVKLAASVSEHLELVDGRERALTIGEGREQTASFKVRAKEALGSGHVVVVASSGDRVSRATFDLSVRPAMPYRITTVSGHFRDGSARAPTPRRLRPEYRTLQATASSVPLVLARGLTHYLEKYPYGCTEQTVSRGWPAFVLSGHPEFGYGGKAAAASVETVIRVLRSRQNVDGAFGFWAANSHVSAFHAVYAMHFLTDAKDKNHPVPEELLSRGLVYLRTQASSDGDGTLAEERLKAYAAYILARNAVVSGAYAEAIEARLEANHAKVWRSDLAAAYLAATHRLLQSGGKASRLVNRLRLGESTPDDYEHYHDGLTRDAQLLYLLARHFPERLESVKGEQLLEMANAVAGGRYNTLSSAYTVLGLAAYADAVGAPARAGLTLREETPNSRLQGLPAPAAMFSAVPFSGDALAVRFDSDGLVFYQTLQAGFDVALPVKEVKEGIEVQREYRDETGKTVNTAALGAEVEVRLRVRTVDGRSLSNIALVDLLPGGFEAVLDSVPRPAPGAPATQAGEDESDESGGEYAEASSAPPGAPAGIDYVDVREDRVVVFGTVGGTAQEFSYRIKAVNRGAFLVPPPMAESMYDRTVQALGVAARMRVE